MTSKPYTYLLGWTNHNKWYYGVQYAKSADPINLWVNYFTSSSAVKEFRLLHGDPDIIDVRRVFTDPMKAKLWEDRVLLSIPKENYHLWLNVRFGQFAGIICTDERNINISKSMTGKTSPFKGLTNTQRIERGLKTHKGKT